MYAHPQASQGQFAKNPNSGYLNPSKFGDDAYMLEGLNPANLHQIEEILKQYGVKVAVFKPFFGKFDVTNELMQEIQRIGAFELKVSFPRRNQKGEPYIRATGKPYDDSWKSKTTTNYAPPAPQAPVQHATAPVQQGIYTPPGQFVQPGAPAPQYAAPPVQNVVDDEIPF
jgi:hypothetical protein